MTTMDGIFEIRTEFMRREGRLPSAIRMSPEMYRILKDEGMAHTVVATVATADTVYGMRITVDPDISGWSLE